MTAPVLDPALRDELRRLRAAEQGTSRGTLAYREARAATDAQIVRMQEAGWSRANIAAAFGVREEQIWRRTGMPAGTVLGVGVPLPLPALVCEPCGRAWPSEEELLDHWRDDHPEMP